MKPKYRSLGRFLPVAVTIVLSSPFAAQAGIFTDDLAGNATPTTLNNGATTIRADGGVPLTPAPFVNIGALINMTGSTTPLETEVLEITSANYTVTNLGTLAGSAHHGINSTFAFTLTNSGTISAAGGNSGIRSVGSTGSVDTSITNNSTGIISGTADGIHFTNNGGTVDNYGTIQGITGATSDGIRGRNDLAVFNMGSGLITGVQHGIYADANVYVENDAGAQITSSGGGDAIHLDGIGGKVDNYGTITGAGGASADGIRGRNGLTVTNFTNVNPLTFGNITGVQYGILADDDLTVTNEATATITGGVAGISAGNGGAILTNVNNSGTITGMNGDGIRAQDSFVVDNNEDGVITGTNGTGVWLNDNASVTNDGSITGTNVGIRIGEGSTVNNTGTISGIVGIDASNGSGSFFNLTNTGTIESTAVNGVAIYGLPGGGVDTFLLNAGSLVIGNIRLKSGADFVTMTAGNSAGSAVNGYIDGGSDFDTLDFVNGMTLPGLYSNQVTGNISDFEDINKTGNGTAFINGNVNSDTIDVTSGALYIVGAVDGTNTTQTAINVVGATAEIGGTGLGLWDANITLTNGATISAGSVNLPVAFNVDNSVGTLRVTGDVTLDAASRYVWNVTPGAYDPGVSHDQIILTGAGNVFWTGNSNFVISATNVNAPLLNGSTIVVDTEAALNGIFGNIDVAAFPSTTVDSGAFQAEFSQNNSILSEYFSTLTQVSGSQDWQLTILHDYSQFGATPNEVAAGNMLDGLVASATGDLADLLAAMDYSPEDYTQAVLAALDPGAYMATAAGLASSNYHLHRTVENHNAGVRAGQADCDGATNVWGSFSYDWQDLKTGNSTFDQDGETAYFAGGLDFVVSENFRLGLVAEGSQTDWSGTSSLGTDVDSYRFAAYANWGAATGWFVDALFGYNTHSIDQKSFAGSTSYDADGWQGLVNVGYTMETSAGTFSPFVGLEWQQLSVDAFEANIGPIPVGISGYDIDSFRALAGVRWEGDLCDTVKGYASAAYAFEFEDDAAVTDVAFGGGSYRAAGLEQGDSLLLSAGIRWSVSDCTTIDLGYRGEFAADNGIDSNGANVGFNYSF